MIQPPDTAWAPPNSAQATYLEAMRNVFALEREADTLKLAKLALGDEIDALNNKLIDLSSELDRRKDAAEAAFAAWRMAETSRTPVEA